jgi:regulator of protease activity HflC (stomatin/prohibitin superfamily)
MNKLLRRSLSLVRCNPRRQFITVVYQGEVAYRSFLGTGRHRLEPGLRLEIPILHAVYRVDLRECGTDIEPLYCYTKDNVPVAVSGTLFHRVLDAEKALFEVTDYQTAVQNIGQSCVRAVMGRFDYDEAIKQRSELNSELRLVIADSIKMWGIECARFEMKLFQPQNEHVARSLEKQMEAERNRRENELNTQALIRSAEGTRDSEMLKADSLYYNAQKVSDAQRYAVEQATQAAINQIKEVKAAVPNLSDDKVLDYILESKRLEHLKAIASSNSSKTYFIDPKSAFPAVSTLFDPK